MMRVFYSNEGPLDTLLQIAERPVQDGDLIGKSCRDVFVANGWVTRVGGWNILTAAGENVIQSLCLRRMEVPIALAGSCGP